MNKLDFTPIQRRLEQPSSAPAGNRIHARFQEVGLELATKLEDKANIGIYMKYAKRYNEPFLKGLLSEVLEIDAKNSIKNKGAYFCTLMWKRLKSL